MSRLTRAAPLMTTLSVLAFVPATALAHSGHDHSGLLAGMMHPLSGLDHLLAMVAVGLWAMQLGGRARWWVPLAFVSMMLAGNVLAFFGIAVPMVEQGILASVLVLGLLIATATSAPLLASLPLVGLFALCHGYAHGAEMAVNEGVLAYSTGFTLVTAILHGFGLFVGNALTRTRPLLGQWIGAGITLAGAALAVA